MVACTPILAVCEQPPFLFVQLTLNKGTSSDFIKICMYICCFYDVLLPNISSQHYAYHVRNLYNNNITKINTHLRINEVDNSMLKVSSWNILVQVTAIFIREMPVNLLKNNFNQQQQTITQTMNLTQFIPRPVTSKNTLCVSKKDLWATQKLTFLSVKHNHNDYDMFKPHTCMAFRIEWLENLPG